MLQNQCQSYCCFYVCLVMQKKKREIWKKNVFFNPFIKKVLSLHVVECMHCCMHVLHIYWVMWHGTFIQHAVLFRLWRVGKDIALLEICYRKQ